MDIFTILVFFLLMNSGDSQTLEDAKFVKLPDSSSEKAPHSDLVIHVGTEELWLDKEKIVEIKDIPLGVDKPIKALGNALLEYTTKLGTLNEYEQANGLSVTIMADKAVPYAVLKSVMATCSGQNFREISLAVNQVTGTVFGTEMNSTPQPEAEGNPQASLKGRP